MKDERYEAVKSLMESKKIVRLAQWFRYVPKTIIAKDAGIHPERFNTLINHVERFTIEEKYALAMLVELDYSVIDKMLYQQFIEELKIKEKNTETSKSGSKGKRSSTM